MRSGVERSEARLMLWRGVIILVAALMITRLWQLQMVQGESYRIRADHNRYREVAVAAPRGVMYDRNGQILARNRPSFTIAVVPGDLPKTKEGEPDAAAESAVLDRLLALLAQEPPVLRPSPTPTAAPAAGVAKTSAARAVTATLDIPDRQPWYMPRAEIEKAVQEGRLGGAYRPIEVARYINEATAFLAAQDAVNLPGVVLQLDPIRDYPSGSLTAHIIGYMGHIPEKRVAEYQAKGYAANEQVGLTGVEATFEHELRGKPGRQTIEVNVNGRRIRTVGQIEPAAPGHNLVLTLDLDLQRVATAALQAALDNSSGFTKATQGVAIALDPRNGKVLALVSLPSYDNNLFAKGVTAEAWQALVNDPDLPMFDQAIGGQYPPGSIFKPIVASAGLQEGVINSRTLLGDGWDGANDGVIWLPNQYMPWDRTKDQPFYSWNHKQGFGWGKIAIRDALAVSDDIYFYQLGGGYLEIFRGVGVDAIGYYARQFGLGEGTGIELPGEGRGLIPDGKWKRLNYAEPWLTGDTYNMSIGQGFVLATPLQMANAAAVVANRGYLYRPQLVDYITDAEGKVVRPFQPDLRREVAVDPAHLDTVREGMYGVVNWPQGTAQNVRIPGIAVAGKTGTAEYSRDWDKDGQADRDAKGNLPTHAWFSAFAPYQDPEIVVTVFIANGGEGSSVAAPVAAKILRAYFKVDAPIPTPPSTAPRAPTKTPGPAVRSGG
jgi:penicillin-binding protein 2